MSSCSHCHAYARCLDGHCSCKEGYLGDGKDCEPGKDMLGYVRTYTNTWEHVRIWQDALISIAIVSKVMWWSICMDMFGNM